MEGYEFPGTDQIGYDFAAHAVNPSFCRIRFPFARAVTYTGAAADEQNNKQAQRIEVFHFFKAVVVIDS